jgi:hypothetical protein
MTLGVMGFVLEFSSIYSSFMAKKTDLEVESGLGQVLYLELLVGLGDEAESNLALAESHGGVPHLVLHQVVVLVQLTLQLGVHDGATVELNLDKYSMLFRNKYLYCSLIAIWNVVIVLYCVILFLEI